MYLVKKDVFSLLIFVAVSVISIKVYAQDPLRFSSEIAAFKNSDQASPPAEGCVLFTGSSSIRFWKTLAADFPGYCVMNRGFGGSQISDVNYFFNNVVAPYKPQMIVLYAGDNDIADGKKPEEILGDLKEFVEKVRDLSAGIPVLFISAKPSPSRWELKAVYEQFNSLAREYCKSEKNVYFIDIFRAMLGENGRPVPALYVQDSLHMTSKGYAIWKSKVDPYMKKFYDPGKVVSDKQ